MSTIERYRFLSNKISQTQPLILSLGSAIQFFEARQDENSESMILFYRKSIVSEIENLKYLTQEFNILKTLGITPEGQNGKERFLNAMELKDDLEQRSKSDETFIKNWLGMWSFQAKQLKKEEVSSTYIEHFLGGGLL